MAKIINLYPDGINLLLPHYFCDSLRDCYVYVGFNVIWAETEFELDKKIKKNHIDLAIEWQHGERDFPIRDLLRKHGKKVNIIFSLNWNGNLPSDFDKLGYFATLEVPHQLTEFKSICYEALLPVRRDNLKKLLIWSV